MNITNSVLIAALQPLYISFLVVTVLLTALGLPTVIIQESGYPTEHQSASLTTFMQSFTV